MFNSLRRLLGLDRPYREQLALERAARQAERPCPSCGCMVHPHDWFGPLRWPRHVVFGGGRFCPMSGEPVEGSEV